MFKIPYSRPQLDQDDIDAVVAVLKQPTLTQGPISENFERALAKKCGAEYAVVVSSGTAALHLACLALDLGHDFEGIVPSITFAATANCLEMAGGQAIFADVTSGLPQLSPESFENKITKKTKVVLPVHFAGSSPDMEKISKIARAKNIFIIEDASHAIGSLYEPNIKVGSCQHSDMTVFSFHAVKNVTTGEGGAVLTNNKELYLKLKSLKHHGIEFPAGTKPAWHYEMTRLGYNYRLTEFQCALGLSQLKKLDGFISQKKALYQNYEKLLKDVKGVQLLKSSEGSSHHLCVISLDKKYNRDDCFAFLRQAGIGVQLHYMPLYRHPYYAGRSENLAQSENYFEHSFSIPLFPGLATDEQEFVITQLKKYLEAHA